MDPYRTNRLSQSIREVVAELLQSAVKDPRVGFVTVNKVELNRDHSVARVFWSVIGDEDERRTSFAGLKKASGFLQSRVGRTLGLRQVPQLRFEYDDTVARSAELDEVLDGLAQQGEFLSEQEKLRSLCLDELQPPGDLMQGLARAQRVWVVPHVNPDPDAVGSALALAEALDAAGKDVRVVGYSDAPVVVQGLPGYARILADDAAAALYLEEEPDTLVLVDCHRIDRTGPLEDLLAGFARRWCIDHHLVSQRRAPEAGWVDVRACSTCTLVHQVIGALRDQDGDPVELTVDMATNLYAGLLNDTGGFRFDNTVPYTFELARRLSECGVDTAGVAAATLHRFRPQGFAMLQRVLGTFTFHAGGRIAVGRATLRMLEETGAAMSDTEGFVNLAMSIDGVEMAALMKEAEAGRWRVSLRSRGGGDVQAVAARHGGGGHRQAAGLDLEGSADDVAALLATELEAALP
jgi:phosphoesterase RecJ-like protein